MCRAFFILVLGLVIATASPEMARAEGAVQTTSSFAYLEKWVGLYPNVDPKTKALLPAGKRLWEDAKVRAAMRESFPDWIMKDLMTCWGEACSDYPIVKMYDNLMVHVCKRSSCVGDAGVVFLNLKTGKAQLCWRYMAPVDEGRVAADFWWADRNRTALGKNRCVGRGSLEQLIKMDIEKKKAETKSSFDALLRKK